MRAGIKRQVGSHNEREQETAAQAGMVLMDLSFRALAVDSGAVSIFAALRDQKRKGSPPAERQAAITEDIRELMLGTQTDSTGSSVVHLSMGDFAYTGRTYCLEPHNGFNQSLMVLYLKRIVSAQDCLGQAGFEYRLTERERETLHGMVMGLTNKELAQRMEISTSTAKAFVRMVMAKMGVTKRAAVVAKVLERLTLKNMNGTMKI
jgi:DNA-binding CsgD family transcriptional regulator